MFRNRLVWLALVGLAGPLLAACTPDADVAPAWEVPGATVPVNFPAPVYPVDQNPPTREAFELGRTLFYDPRLSRTGDISCGSCHQQFVAFAHQDHRLSHGVDNRLSTRNAPALQNLRWRRELLWDGGAKHLETMPLAPITNPVEMDETLDGVLAKLNADPTYQRRFEQVFGRKPIDSQQLLKALAQFTAALTSSNSRYDKHARREAGGELSAAELRGLAVLRQKCASCHAGELFTDESYRNNGLDAAFAADSGRAGITGRPQDVGRFKVPSLRNVALTAPYMHDGRFRNLREVLDHYAGGMVESATLDAQLRQSGSQPGIALTEAEKTDLLAFLATLTDEAFVRDPRLAEQ
ncbi:cytochrome-c peroxidase [Hymenobacter weizhouensis]|uniref:cytochrome-c peroxidase n=1 Tax=Hymenobacter sp. YIM 151500-1 TaxID=2987689 RepID=UPI0022268E08|nr:cytochrome c peroxidase [Hymenobacter sp. YIM 151500-1]UYZ64811.1 cytochrome-c peroxidase [Hymenobacter sp. YIM 151500-1]